MAPLMLAIVVSFAPVRASAQPCGAGSPATPIPEFRGDVKLWPDRIRPLDPPGQPLPKDRDSTDYVGNTYPNVVSGHEQFQSIDIAADTLFVAYNAGLQAWRIDGQFATAPQRVAFRDGLLDHFLSYPGAGEQDGYIHEIAAMVVPEDPTTVVVALAGIPPVGLTLWAYDVATRQFRALYQQTSAEAFAVALVEHDGEIYSISAGGNQGMHVHDVGAALSAGEPCIDDPPGMCPGVHRGTFAEATRPLYVAVHAAPGGVLVAGSVGGIAPMTPLPTLWWVPDPGTPATAVQLAIWGTKSTHAPVFIPGRKLHLAASQDDAIVFRDVTSCLSGGVCGELEPPEHVFPLASPSLVRHKLTLSRAFDRDILHHGVETLFLSGPSIEPLLDVTDIDREPPFDILTGGQTYVDPCHGASGIGYFADGYESNGNGLRGNNPRRARFNGPVLYRVSTSVIDVHIWDGPEPDVDPSTGGETGSETGAGPEPTTGGAGTTQAGGSTTCDTTICIPPGGTTGTTSAGPGPNPASGGEPPPDPGCACTTTAGAAGEGLSTLLLLVGLGGTRRRRQTAR